MIVDLPKDINSREAVEKTTLCGVVSFQASTEERICAAWSVNGRVFEIIWDVSLGKVTISPDPDEGILHLFNRALQRDKIHQANRQRAEVVKGLAISCEGKAITDLTRSDKDALLLTLLLKRGAIDENLNIRPVGLWM